jgi:hypothetical protein
LKLETRRVKEMRCGNTVQRRIEGVKREGARRQWKGGGITRRSEWRGTKQC